MRSILGQMCINGTPGILSWDLGAEESHGENRDSLIEAINCARLVGHVQVVVGLPSDYHIPSVKCIEAVREAFEQFVSALLLPGESFTLEGGVTKNPRMAVVNILRKIEVSDPKPSLDDEVYEFRRGRILDALRSSSNTEEAAKKLGLSEGRLKELIERLNIVPR